MTNIDECLKALSLIDDNILFAEINVVGAQQNLNDKISEMYKYSDDSVGIKTYIQESTGTRATNIGFINKIITLIKRCIRKIIDVISDFTLGFDAASFEYLVIPYDYDKLMYDLGLFIVIDQRINDVIKGLKDENSLDKYMTDIKKIEEDLKKANYFKLSQNEKKAVLLKKDTWFKLRDKIRELKRWMKDSEKYMDNVSKSMEKINNLAKRMNPSGSETSICDKQIDILKECNKVYSDLATATTKIFSSFKNGNAKGMKSNSAVWTKTLPDGSKVKFGMKNGQLMYQFPETGMKPEPVTPEMEAKFKSQGIL